MKKFTKVLAAIILMAAMVFAAGCKPENDPNNGGGDNGGNTYNGHEYVDLGLPSGILWATCNVGAEKPEDYGDYFAWGEIQSKSIYYWSTYNYCDGGRDKLTKYCNDSVYGVNGFTDYLTILEPVDDAATVHWGVGWRTPTREEWGELYSNTDNEFSILNGVEGWLFTANNGNCLFLPCADWIYGPVESRTFSGDYWSSSYVDFLTGPDYAWCFYFGWSSCQIQSVERSLGLSVRPVRSASQD